MKKITAFFFTLLMLASMATAQDLVWAKSMGSNGIDRGRAITTDAAGNVYVTGSFSGTVDFDPGSSTSNLTARGNDVFVQKLDAQGNLLWAKKVGGQGFDFGSAIAVDAVGNVYVQGKFGATVDFDPGTGSNNLSSAGNDDIFILKLDKDGNFVWAKSMGGDRKDQGTSLAVVKGNVYSTGYFNGTADFDSGSGTNVLTSAGGEDVFVQKMDADGNLKWVKRMGGTRDDVGMFVTADTLGNVVVAGYFEGTADFDPSAANHDLVSNGKADAFVVKVDSSGNMDWVNQMGSTRDDVANAVAMDNYGDIITTGSFGRTVDFDPGPGVNNLSSKGEDDAFIQKVDSTGKFKWAKSMGSTKSDHYETGNAVTTDADGNIITSGTFEGTVNFAVPDTHNLSSHGESDIFIQKRDMDGNPLWVTSVGGSGTELIEGMAVDDAGDIVTTGFFTGTGNFDPNNLGANDLLALGSSDIFIQKINIPVGVAIRAVLDSKINLYPNPSKGLFYIELPAGTRAAQIQVADGIGRLVYRSTLYQAKSEFDLSHLSAGIYHLKMQLNAKEIFYGKIILKK